MGEWVFARATYGPLSGYTSGWCDLPHWGMVLAGDLALRFEDRVELLSGRGRLLLSGGPPGHQFQVADARDDDRLHAGRRICSGPAERPNGAPRQPELKRASAASAQRQQKPRQGTESASLSMIVAGPMGAPGIAGTGASRASLNVRRAGGVQWVRRGAPERPEMRSADGFRHHVGVMTPIPEDFPASVEVVHRDPARIPQQVRVRRGDRRASVSIVSCRPRCSIRTNTGSSTGRAAATATTPTRSSCSMSPRSRAAACVRGPSAC